MQNSFNQSTVNNSIITSDSPLYTTAFGILSLQNSTGENNSAIGSKALQNNLTGSDTVALGYQALQQNNTGQYNVAIGSAAMQSSVTESYNTAIGYQTLFSNSTGEYNTAVGRNALQNNTGSFNTAVGAEALSRNTAGSYNTVVGRSVLRNNVGNDNVGSGYFCLSSNSLGQYIVAVGSGAMQNSTSATNTVAIGYHALQSLYYNDFNTAVGFRAIYYCITGQRNTGLGSYSLLNVLGSDNTAIGYEAGSSFNSTETNNICIGVTGSINDGSVTRIGANIDSCFISGIYGKISSGGVAVFCNPSGQLGTTTSSIRYKTDIRDITESDAIYKLRPICFRFKNAPDFQEYGLIAEEVNEVLPDLVVNNDDNQPETVRYQFLPILMLKELQKIREENIYFKKTLEGAVKKLLY
jgi:trimeric autotransporter adhesin